MDYIECRNDNDDINWDELTHFIAKSEPCNEGWARYTAVCHLSLEERWELTHYRERVWLRHALRNELGALAPTCAYLGIELFMMWSPAEFAVFWTFIQDWVV